MLRKKKSHFNNVLILGSAPNAIRARSWENHPFSSIVAINNAWRIRTDWSHNIFPTDFPIENRPRIIGRKILITARDYVKVQNKFGGFVYAGGTMAFTTAYWVLSKLRPDNLFFLGCDMVYHGSQTHFYGKGNADPLREDITLRSLEAKSKRFECFAFLNNCSTFNLSTQIDSRLTFRRIKETELWKGEINGPRVFRKQFFKEAEEKEKELNYYIEDGKYWKHIELFDVHEIDKLDKLWLSCYDNQ